MAEVDRVASTKICLVDNSAPGKGSLIRGFYANDIYKDPGNYANGISNRAGGGGINRFAHTGGTNCLFWDGHVEWLKLVDSDGRLASMAAWPGKEAASF
jgi:prepilin-type processing-associated H-X9-DG protein